MDVATIIVLFFSVMFGAALYDRQKRIARLEAALQLILQGKPALDPRSYEVWVWDVASVGLNEK